jgi:hypothetical protein
MRRTLSLIVVAILATSALLAGEVIAPAGEEKVGVTGITDGPGPSLAKEYRLRDDAIIVDGPEPFGQPEVASQRAPFEIPWGDDAVIVVTPPVIVTPVPEACFDNITDCRNAAAAACGAGGVSSNPRKQARLAVCTNYLGREYACCKWTCADGTQQECRSRNY